MALTASPPRQLASDVQLELNEKLDEDIARVRGEIQALTKRRNLLSASVLSSSRVQTAVQASTSETDTNQSSTVETDPLLLSQLKHNQSNIHRLSFGVTAFPFYDPSPEITTNPLIGIRFDIPSRTGKFDRAPYYIFCKKKKSIPTADLPATTTTTLSIHHHTVPALIPLQAYEARYLPQEAPQIHAPPPNQPDEGYYGSTSPSSISLPPQSDSSHQASSKQNLHALVAAVRSDLSSWVQRQEAIDYISETLGLSTATTSLQSTSTIAGEKGDLQSELQQGRFGVSSLGATGLDARFIRLVWTDGRVGRLKLSDEGYITKAAVFADVQLKDVERMLSTSRDGGSLNVLDLVMRLEDVEKHTQVARGVRHDDIELHSESDDDDHVQMDET